MRSGAMCSPIPIRCAATYTPCEERSTSLSTDRCCIRCPDWAIGSPMKTRQESDSRIRAWLGRAFLTQAALISIAAIVGVFVASALLEGVLIRAALNDEAHHFWRQRDADPQFQLPNTRNLSGYFDDTAPPALRGMAPGYHEWEHDGVDYVVYVTERNRERLYLAFDRTNVSRLAAYYGL